MTASSAIKQPSSFDSIPAGERETIVRRLAATGMSDSSIANVFGVGQMTIYNFRRRLGIPSSYAESGRVVHEYDRPAILVETDEMAAKFAKAMRGQTYTEIKTKSYGRMGHPPATDVISQSNIARCG